MWKIVLVTGLLAASSVYGQILQEGRCNDSIPLENNFNMNDFAGTWYDIRSAETSWSGDCAFFEFQTFDTGAIAVTHSTVRQNFLQQVSGTGTLVPNTARLSLTIPEWSSSGDIDFWVIDTVYNNYALAYGCQNVGTEQRNVFVWQLSREPIFIFPLLSDMLNTRMSQLLYVTNDDLRDTSHEEDGCFILPVIEPGEPVILSGRCNENITGVVNFDVSQFLGVWHQISAYQSENANGTCNRAQYSDGSGVVNVVNSQIVNQELRTISGSATVIGTGNTGHLNVTLEVLPGEFVDSELKVLATDYLNWAVSYTCIDVGENSRQIFSWILSRTRVLLPPAQVQVNQVINSYIELNDQYYQSTDQTQTGCFYVPTPVLNQPVVFGGQCDQNIAVVSDFNATQYLGVWHDIESYPSPFQGGTCATAEYSLGDGVVNVYNTQVVNQTLDEIYGTAVQVGSDAKLVVTFPVAGTNETTNTDYWVIATDYDSYSLVYSCSNINDYQQQVTVWKLSRSKSLINQSDIDNAMAQVPVIDQQFFEGTDQTPGGCYFVPEPTGEVVRFPGQCEDENVPVVEEFDLARFAGEWYEVQSYPKDDQQGQCISHQFVSTGTGLVIATSSVSDQLMVLSQGQLTRINTTSTDAAFDLTILGQNPPVSFPYYIIATDYDNYTLAYSCVNDGDYFKKIYAWKLGRTNELSAEHEEAIGTAAADIDVIREKYFEPTLHTDYACYFFPLNLNNGDPVILGEECSDDVPVMQNFDAGRYLGRWRLLESYPSDNQLGSCNEAYYELNGTEIIVQNSEVRNQTLSQDIGIAVLENATVGLLSVTFPGAPEPVQLYVLDTDYQTYSLVHACINLDTNPVTSRVFSWKMSRSKSLVPEALNAIAATVDTIKVLNNRYYVTNDHSDEGCFYLPAPGAPIVVFPGQCDETIPVVSDFNVTAYMNLWHDVASYPLPFQNGDCPNAFYSLGDDGVDVFNTQVIDQSVDTIRGIAVLANDTSTEAKLLVSFPSVGNLTSNYWVLATDYEDYAFVYACENMGEEYRQVSSWKLSRSKSLSQAAGDVINNIISTIPVLNDQYYVGRDQSSEGCFYLPDPEPGKPVEFPGECDMNIPAVPDFDLQRFEGVWHEIEAYPKIQQQGDCIRHDFTIQQPTNNSFSLQSLNVIAESLGITDGVVEFSNNDTSARFSITFTSNGTSYEIPYWIIDTDYDNYAVAYSCINNENADFRNVFSWKLSRTRELLHIHHELIRNATADIIVLDERYYEEINQTDNACFYLPDLQPGEPVIFPGSCDPNITVVPNFDAGRYLGEWRLIESYPSAFQIGTCGDTTYTLDNETIIVVNTEVVNQTLNTITGQAVIIGNGILLVTFPEAPTSIEYWVLDTDYDSYSIVYSCVDINPDERHIFSWKLSKTNSLDSNATAAIDAVLDRVDVLHQRYYQADVRSDAGCFYYPIPDGNIVTFRGQCDETIPVVAPFVLNDYTGLWYDVGSYPLPFQNGDCPNARYTLGIQGVEVYNTQVINQTLDTISGLAYQANASSDEAKLLVNFPSIGNFVSNYWVLTTNYTDYALVYSCENVGERRQISSWKLSRSKSLSADAEIALTSIIDTIPVLDDRYYIERDQTAEGCFYFPDHEPGKPVEFPGECDLNVTVVPNFDLQRFEGVWHEIEAYPKEQQQGGCIRHDFTVSQPTNNSFNLQSFNVIAESLGITNGIVTLSGNDNSAKFTITFTTNSTTFTIPYWIIDTDYDNYALAYSCINRNDIDYRGVFSWKLSRTKDLPQIYGQRIEDAMADIDVIDQRYFETVDQNDEACFYLPDLAPGEPVVFPGQCYDNITVVPNFDASRYLGRWKLIEHYPSDFQIGTCGEAEYSLGNNNEIIVRNTEVINETLSVDIGAAEIIANGKLLVQFPDAPEAIELWVLDTDYVSYSIVYSCRNIGSEERRVFSWKLSKTDNITESATAPIAAVLDRVNVLDQRYYVDVDRTPASCFYYPVPDGRPVRFRAQCDVSIPVVTGFDPELYGGLWYDLASYPLVDQNGECPNAFYTLGDGGVDVFNTQVINQTLDTIRGVAILANASSDEAKLLVNFPTIGPFYSNYWILSTDYSSYALVYSCFNIDDEYMQVFSWKLSRTKELTANATAEINSVIESIHVLNDQYYLDRDQSDDECFYFPEKVTGRPVEFPGRCDVNATVEQNFNLNRFQGRWHELETYPKEQQTGECLSHEFTVSGNSFQLQTFSVQNEAINVSNGIVTFTSEDNSARFIITIQVNGSNIVIPYWISDTDYDNYALAYSCVNYVDERGIDMRTVYSWKLSRTRQLSLSAIQAINNAMSDNEVLDNRYYEIVDHTDDGCFNIPVDLAPGDPVIFGGQCDPILPVVANFDALRYLGMWNLIETYPSDFQIGTCADSIYAPSAIGNNNILVQNTEVVNETLSTMTGNAVIIGNGKLSVTFPNSQPIEYWVMDTDYDSYSLVYSCVNITPEQRRVYSWKLSRSQSLTPNANTAMDAVLSRVNVLNQRFYLEVDRSDEGCFYYPTPNDNPTVFRGSCDPNVAVVSNFDATRYLGTWNLIENYPSAFQQGTCADATYSLANDGSVTVVNREVRDQALAVDTGRAVVIGDGKLEVTFPDAPVPIEYWVLDTDYSSYSIVYSCVNLENNRRNVFSWKLSRTNVIENTAAVNAVLDRVQVLDQRYYKTVDRTDEGCFYYPVPDGSPVVLPGRCDENIPVEPNFDILRYEGTWYQIERYPQPYENANNNCVGARYTYDEDAGVVNLINWEVVDDELLYLEGTATLASTDGSAKLNVELPIVGGNGTRTSSLYILKTDYDTYSLAYSCSNLEGNRRSIAAWKLSRTRSLPAAANNNINTVIADRSELRQDYFISIEQNDECQEPSSGVFVKSSIIVVLLSLLLQHFM